MTDAELITGTEQEIKTELTITPDFLPTEQKHRWLSEQLLRTQQGYNLLHPRNKNLIPPSQRGTKVATSGWDDRINAVHLLLHDPDFKFPIKPERPHAKLANSKFSVTGTALHQLSNLTGLINYGKMDEKSIHTAFPTYSRKALIPYVEALKETNGQSLFDIWEKFRCHPGLMDLIVDEEAWILKEFPEIPLSKQLQEEVKTRRGPGVFEAGCKLIPHFMTQMNQGNANVYFEPGIINNWKTLSPEGNTRVQIPNRSDWVISFVDEYGKSVIMFLDVKTGKIQLEDYAHKFQALLMHFMDGHFVDNVMRKGYCPRRKEKPNNKDSWYTIPTIDKVVPRSRNYTLDYLHFDTQTGKLTPIPIRVDYSDRDGRMFLKMLAFYSDAINALGKPGGPIDHYLQTGEVLNVFPKNIRTQNELPFINGTVIDLSNIPPARAKPEKQYKVGDIRGFRTTCPIAKVCGECDGNISAVEVVTQNHTGRAFLEQEGYCELYPKKWELQPKKPLRSENVIFPNHQSPADEV